MALNDDIDTSPTGLHNFNIRTITMFVKIDVSDFVTTTNSSLSLEQQKTSKSKLEAKIEACAHFAHNLQRHFEDVKVTVQTVRIATNPFEEYLSVPNESLNVEYVSSRLSEFDSLLKVHFNDIIN